MIVVWTRSARHDLALHFDYLEERTPAAALRVDETIREATERLAEFPYRGRPGRLEGTRELVIVDLPYIVVYRVRERTLRVLRVLHSAQDWPTRLGS
jgi:addiction module RelE/StbE family toxin